MRFSIALAGLVGVSSAASIYRGTPQIPLDEDTPQAVPIPKIGFGTWNLKGVSSKNTSDAVSYALQTGYTHIDCAAAYGNEKDVGKGIADGLKKAGLKRDAIWVTSKLWNDHHDNVEAGLNQTLSDLGLDYLDLYLMHWPVGTHGKHTYYDYLATWKSMEALLPTGRVKHIGISNFSPAQLLRLIYSSSTKPAVHQMELHPYLQQGFWVKFHQAHGIAVTAYSPLGDTNPTYHKKQHVSVDAALPRVLDNPVLTKIALLRNCTVAQVALNWGMSRGTAVIPKSSHENWIKENFEAKDCVLLPEDVGAIEQMQVKYLKRFNNPSKDYGVHLFEGLDGA